jgi:hypothetical protein
MGSHVLSHVSRSATAAVLLSLMIVGQSAAATWTAPIRLTSSGEAYVAGGLVGLPGSSVVVAAYQNKTNIVVRRSLDSGATWLAPVRLSRSGGEPAIAGRGRHVDVVWRQSTSDGQIIRYVRSTDAGATFTSPLSLSSGTGSAWWPSVARGRDGLVAIAWYDNSDIYDGKIRVRVSTNGGASFGSPATIVKASDANVAVAAGRGVVYALYSTWGGPLRVKRSFDGGQTWSSAKTISEQGFGSITAAGSTAYVSYVSGGRSAYRWTTNKGANWSAEAYLPGKSGFGWKMSLKGGVLRAIYSRYLDDDHEVTAIVYRESTDGVHWTQAERVPVPSTPQVYPIDVAYAGRVAVLYAAGSAEDDSYDIFASSR